MFSWIFSLLFCWQLYLIIILTCFAAKIGMYITTGRYKIKKSMEGKVVLITGGTSGIGKETASELAKHGATVHILARDMQKAEIVLDELKRATGNTKIYIHHVDLADFSTVRTFAEKFLSKADARIDVLINNAGTVNIQQKITTDGNENTFQTNHLSHFLLTNLLLSRLICSAPSRIINLSSMAHKFVNSKRFKERDFNFEHTSYDWRGFTAYCWSKLENILFTRELASRLKGTGVTVNAAHPGAVRTPLYRESKWTNAPAIMVNMVLPFFKKSLDGAQTTLYLATSDSVTNVSGQYFCDCRPQASSLISLDDQLALDLWNESEKLTGLNKQ